jgi:hypothetical protein
MERPVFFRFGEWCYQGRLALSDVIQLQHLPTLIPGIQRQQDKLKFLCSREKVPVTCPFTCALQFISQASQTMMPLVMQAESSLQRLLEMMKKMGQVYPCIYIYIDISAFRRVFFSL